MNQQLAMRLGPALPGEIAVDLFAGGGGASKGIEEGIDVKPAIAINHDPEAIAMHAANHPETEHLQEDIYRVVPSHVLKGRKVGLLWASPDCRHFSKAKGSKPVSKRVRSLASVVIRWAKLPKEMKPRVIVIENVREFLTWGPCIGKYPDPKRKGQTFHKWAFRLRREGYHLEWRVLNAADYGAPTSRRRLFIVARCDGQPIVWPKASHGPSTSRPWRSAAQCIDWSLPCPSIFGRKKPHAEKTLARIARGVHRFVINNPKPFIVPQQPGAGTHGNNDHLVAAFMAKHYGGVTGQTLDKPLGTVTTVDHHSIVLAHLTKFYGTCTGADVEDPMPTITTGGGRGGQHMGLVLAFLVQYYGGSDSDAQGCSEPLRTVVTKARHALVLVRINGTDYVIQDIAMRMLEPEELAAAQGFPRDYILTGTKSSKIARIGNSVSPPVARAVVAANLLGDRASGTWRIAA